MKSFLIGLVIVVLGVSFFTTGLLLGQKNEKSPVSGVSETPRPTPFVKYSMNNLLSQDFPHENIQKGQIISETDDLTSYLFKFNFSPTLDSDKKTVSGFINIPKAKGKYPVVLLIRGYVDQKLYITGMGSNSAGKFFAENGFIALSPDFLGYGDSDKQADNIFESRFQTYTTVLSLLSSLGSIDEWDGKNIFIWAHSNGGQIALTALSVSGEEIPTALWAPVTKPFPYSVLYYTDESEDGGKYIRTQLAEFEKDYDVESFSFDSYLVNIKAPIVIHQGGNDDAVPLEWSKQIKNKLEGFGVDVTLHTYPSADHNMRPAWDSAIETDLEFFQNNIDKES